jgi:hypothetical protein
MTHELTITYDLQFIARPFGISCTCNFKAAAETYAEAVRVVRAHQESEEQKMKAREARKAEAKGPA